ncbi:MAG: type VI secretion system amidase effector protein Tae4 [Sphingobacterium sp.]|jgi:hypothetical protein|nr:type VI secretion system amidase effector protein Tae4 [Sphingobacterium sp.]
MENIKFGSYSPQKAEKVENDFIPVVSLNKKWGDPINCFYVENPQKRTTRLSSHLDADKVEQTLEQLYYRGNHMILNLKVDKGNKNANDNRGIITVKSDKLKFIPPGKQPEDAQSTIKLKQVYGTSFSLSIVANNIKDKTECFIDFYADDDDFYFFNVSNVFCGRISLTYQQPLFPRIYANYPKPYTSKPCNAGYEDQCAIRMSMALMNSGITLENVQNYSNRGGDTYCKHGHVLGASNLMKHISTLRFWKKRTVYDGTKQRVYDIVRGKTGILYFENFVERINGVSLRRTNHMHIEVWDGRTLVSGFDIQMFDAATIVFFEIE